MKTLAFALFVVPASLAAQTVSVTFTTVAPLVARAYSSTLGTMQQQIVPANQSGPQTLHPQVATAEALCGYGNGSGTTWVLRADCYEAAPAFAQVAGDVLLHVSATSPVLANIDFVHALTLSAGALGPAFSIDYGDDGIVEVSEAGVAVPGFGAVQLGPTPLPIRLRAAVTQVGVGFIDLALGVAITPATAQVNPITTGCAPASLFAYPVFAGSGVEFTVAAPGPVVLVLGLGLQPQPLPLAISASCVLLPSPDLLVPMVAPPLPYFTLPLPAAVRPVTLFAQGVVLFASGLGTTNSYSIFAF
jgi:hypothetical protein